MQGESSTCPWLEAQVHHGRSVEERQGRGRVAVETRAKRLKVEISGRLGGMYLYRLFAY